MSGRSRWWGGLSSLIGLAMAASCSQLPIPPYNDGGAGDTTPPMTLGPHALTPVPVDAVGLAADDSGIYWTSPANELWVLPPGAPLPVPLTLDSHPGLSCSFAPPPVPTASHVFWSSSNPTAIHRTRKDGSGDETLASPASAWPGRLAADTSSVYWSDRVPDGEGGAVRALPLDAPAASTPTTLVRAASDQDIYSLAAHRDALYWTPFKAVASSYMSTLWSATLDELAQGSGGAAVDAPRSPYALTSTGGDLLFAFYADPWTSSIARLPVGGAPQTMGTLPTGESVLGLAAVDGWALASTDPGGGCNLAPLMNLYATPLAGGTPKLIAQGIRAAAIAAPQGIVFVDADRHLVALPADQIDGMVSPVP